MDPDLELIASAKDPAGPVQAVITESAEPVYINERRDTTEAPPLVAPTIGDVDATMPTPREIVDATTSEIAPRTLQAALIADGRAAAYKTQEVVPESKPAEDAPAPEPSGDAARPTVRAAAIVVAAAAGSAPAITADTAVAVPRATADPDDDATRPTTHAIDAIAQERGVTPIRMPSESSAYLPVREPRPSRALLVAAMSVAAACVVVTIGTIVWARSAVADAHQPDTAATPPMPAPSHVEPAAPAFVLPITPAAPATCSITVRASLPGLQADPHRR